LVNRIYADYDDLRLAAVDAWQKAALNKDIVKSVCFTKYAQRIYYSEFLLVTDSNSHFPFLVDIVFK
jgi:hypothetical protein